MGWIEVFFMGGYGPYVWGAYALALASLGGEVLFLLRRQNALARYRDLSVQK